MQRKYDDYMLANFVAWLQRACY